MKRANPFSRNVGMAGRLYHLEQDPEDAAFADPDPATDVDPQLHVEMLADSTEKSLNNFFGKRRNEGQSAYAIMMKKRFKVKDPNLLTWTERKAIAHLHQSDPAIWTIKRLADSYPAREEVIQMLASKKPSCGDSAKVIASVDQEVRDNWHKMAKGKLEVSEELAERLEQLQINPKDRLKQLDKIVSEEMSQMLIEQNQKLLKGPEMKCGEFGQIIRSYNAKVEAKRKALEQKKEVNVAVESEKISAEIPAMFDPKSEFNVNMGNVPSPYRDTAMVNVSDGNFYDEYMTQERFKEKRLKHKTFSGHLSDKIEGDHSGQAIQAVDGGGVCQGRGCDERSSKADGGRSLPRVSIAQRGSENVQGQRD